jgi:hypothetical protein
MGMQELRMLSKMQTRSKLKLHDSKTHVKKNGQNEGVFPSKSCCFLPFFTLEVKLF